MPSSADLHRRRSAAVARGVSSMIPSYVASAGGGTMTDVDGREWIDFAAGIAVTNVGNAAPRVVAAAASSRPGSGPPCLSSSRPPGAVCSSTRTATR